MFPAKVFITGTDTGVGKTLVSAILVKALNAYYFKPIQTGSIEGTDSNYIQTLTKLPSNYFLPEVYTFKEPVSPHLAAKLEQKKIILDKITCPLHSPLVVEGAGGLLVPINKKFFMLDIIKKFSLPVILVARSTLGTINHTLMSLKILKDNNVSILGVILNGPINKDNKEAIEFYGKIKVLTEIDYSQNLKKSFLQLTNKVVNDILKNSGYLG
ncbi:MAG: dethiobiotin synthase [Desulfonauticus sp.]|nr:dethiobiotin synthase [Desulfonauticus sp.]